MRNTTRDRITDRDERRETPSSPLKIQHRLIDTLQLDARNARVHSEKQIAQIAESIRVFGFNVPVLIDDDNKIIAGHGRVLACKLLGITEIPIIPLTHLSSAQVKAFIIADNKLAENSTWDEILLGEQLRSLSEIDLTFSLEATGFEMGEIDILIEGLSQPVDVDQDPADDLPAQSEISVSAPGDLWQLGRHRVLCGNSLEPESYALLMCQQLADVVFTDPPYNVPIDGHASGLGKKQHGDFAMACGEMNRAEFTDFLATVCKRLVGASRDGSIHFICMDWRHVGELLAAGKEAYDEVKNICVWVKDNAGMGSLYRSQHEFILVFKQGKHFHRNNVQLGQFGRYRSNVWRYPGANSFSRSSAEGNLLALHPTVKPVALVADAIMDCSSRGDIVLDPFLGSGTTIIGAERTGRICYGIELDPIYVDTVVRRWQRFTGLPAVHSDSQRNFDDLDKEANDARQR
jgi:DNA modification methylase